MTLLALALLPLAAGTVVRPADLPEEEFDNFIAKYHRNYTRHSPDYLERLSIFRTRFNEAQRLNALPGRGWRAGMTPLADYTDKELKQIRGWKGARRSSSGRSNLNLLQNDDLPENWQKWRNLKTLQVIANQGSCGSCWAVTSATILNAHREIYRNATELLSPQELVNCVPNPQNCGGSGGCEGATVELAMAYTMRNGLSKETDQPYAGSDQQCLNNGHALLELSGSDDFADSGVRMATSKSVGLHTLHMQGWEKLPENKYEPLKRALVTKGPVAVSVSADGWELYMSGIFGDCPRDAVIDHAVTLIAYGQEYKTKYWTIQNSWGDSFGEQGTMRLLRQDQEEDHCGTDYQPQMGTGCDGGPASVQVCGMCGILYDSVVPIFGH
ncbi:Probable cysteine protease RD21C [Durusdinium trenchii]